MNVGSLIAYLDLDDSNFDRKTKNANRQIDGLKLHLETLSKMNPKVDVEVRTKTAQLDALQAELAALKARAAEGEDVKVDTAEAMFKLAALKAEIRSLHAEALKPIEVKADVTQLDRMNKTLDNTLGKLKGINGPGGILGTLLAVGPALLPVGSAITGVLAGVTGGALEAAGAVGILATAIKGIDGGVSAYQTYQQAVASANFSYEQALQAAGNKSAVAPMRGKKGHQVAGTSPRAAAIASANAAHEKALQTAQHNLDGSAYGKMTGAGQQFVQYDVGTFQPFKHQLSQAAQAGVLPGLTALMHGVVDDGPQITGAISSISASIGGLLSTAGHAMQSPFWKQWLTWFGAHSAQDVKTMGHALGEFTHGAAEGLEKMAPLTTRVVDGTDKLMGRFEHWVGSPAFDAWMARTQKDMTDVEHLAHEAAPVVRELFQAFRTVGGVELSALTNFVQILGEIPAPIATALLTVGEFALVGSKIAGPFGSATDGLKKFLAVLYPVPAAATAAAAAETELTAATEAQGAAALTTGQKLASWGAKAALAAGGALMLYDGLTKANGASGALQDAMGGAAIGATFGPWGAAVGGVVGGLAGVVKWMFHAGDAARTNYAEIGKAQALKDATLAADGLRDSLNQVTGAYTSATQAAAVQSLTKNDPALLSYLKSRGVSTTQAVRGLLGMDRSSVKAVNTATANLPAAVDSANTHLQQLKDLKNNGNYAEDSNGNTTGIYLHGNSGPTISISDLDKQITAAQRYQADITKLANEMPDFKKKLQDQTKSIQQEAIAENGLALVTALAGDKLKKWPTQLVTQIKTVGTDQALKGLQGIAAASIKAGMKPMAPGQALAVATIMVNSDPSIAHTKANIDAVAQSLEGIKTPVTPTINAPNTGGFFSGIAAVVASLNLGGGGGSKPKPKGKHAGGTPYTFEGDILVGEMGPEILRGVPNGMSIVPNNQTREVLSDRGGSTRIHPDDLRTLARMIAAASNGAAHQVLSDELNYLLGG